MRLTAEQITAIKSIVLELCGSAVTVRLFGSRVDDNKRGGDVDLLLESHESIEDSMWLSAQVSARVSRTMEGRKVDVLVSAPNLESLPIHQVALEEGILL